ncbi:hypothetical protein JCM10213_007895 [Rhodosporidiobolus nylandii]
MPPSTDPSAPTQPSALRIPDDVWFVVLERNELSYADLKRFSRVCKRFHEYEQDPSLDTRFFRSPPVDKLEKGQSVTFHPALDKTNLVCMSVDDASIFVDDASEKNGYRDVRVVDYPCADEYATSPASKIVSLNMGEGVAVVKDSGVTVRDVVEASATMWSSKPPLYIREEIAEMYLPLDPDYDLDTVTWRDTLVDHCFYEGMNLATVPRADGVVVLHPHGFGSRVGVVSRLCRDIHTFSLLPFSGFLTPLGLYLRRV